MLHYNWKLANIVTYVMPHMATLLSLQNAYLPIIENLDSEKTDLGVRILL